MEASLCRAQAQRIPGKEPGDLVEVDTLDVRPTPGVILKHFTARDVIGRWDVVEVHRRATATTAKRFLETLLKRMPFPVKAIQVDGGSEFEAAFEKACRERTSIPGLPRTGRPTMLAGMDRSTPSAQWPTQGSLS